MSRTQVVLREAGIDDALFLVALWRDSLRRADTQEQVADLEQIIKGAAESAELRLLIADFDGEPAGAVYLRLATTSPINLEPTLQIFSLTVAQAFRRKGIGHALLDGAVAFAEQAGISTLATAASSGSRDANRFLARLTFAAHATWRTASVRAVRAKLAPQSAVGQRPQGRSSNLGQVLAARRSMRRAQPES